MRSNKTFIPFSQRLVREAIGKKYVIKHYRYGIVKTKYPDMKNIVASSKQLSCRERFKKANAFAKAIYSDPAQRMEWNEKLRRPRRLYNAIMRAYDRIIKDEQAKRLRDTNKLIRTCFAEEKVEIGEKRRDVEVLHTGISYRRESGILNYRKLLLAG